MNWIWYAIIIFVAVCLLVGWLCHQCFDDDDEDMPYNDSYK